MPLVTPSARRHRRLGFPAAAAAVLLLSLAAPACADIVPLADQLRGVEISKEQCDALPRAVYVAAAGREFCIRYYLSVAGGPGKAPLVLLQGDRLGRLDFSTGEFTPGPRDKDVDTKDYNKVATLLSKQAGLPAIYLARPGLDGSSGNHRIRRTTLELLAVNAALDAIKARHEFAGYHMLGQSGGSTLIGGLLELRSDIGCAVIGAGMLSLQRPNRSPDPGKDFFNVADSVGTIARKPGTRIMLVTDPADRKVPERFQTDFAQKLRVAGGQAEQFLVQATDPDRHGVLSYARIAAMGCLRGTPNEEIGTQLARQVERALAVKTAKETQLVAESRDGGFQAPAR